MSDRRSLAFAALAGVWLLGLQLLGVEAAFAYLAPALLILLPLLGGRYPGDEALARPHSSQPERTDSRRARRNDDEHHHTGSRRDRALTLAPAGTAGAHITANPGEAPSDGFATLDFSVGHGCEESPTTQLRIKVPPSVPSVTPGVHPLWDVATKEGKKDKVELHGETITRGVSEVIYTAKEPLPPDRLDLVTMSVKLPAGEEGETVYFPTVQSCEKGQNRWIQIPAEGENPDELEEPAPAVVLTAAEGGHGAVKDTANAADTEPAANVQAAAVTAEDDDGAPMWLAITALAVGALGLLAGIGGLMASRRRA